jgi:hypothetical protein
MFTHLNIYVIKHIHLILSTKFWRRKENYASKYAIFCKYIRVISNFWLHPVHSFIYVCRSYSYHGKDNFFLNL